MKFLIVALATVLSSSAFAGQLSFSMSNRANLIPVKQQSCEDELNGDPTIKSLAENSAKFSGITFSWNGSTDVELQYITVTLTSPVLDPSPQTFKMTFIGNNPVVSSQDMLSMACGIRLGGVQVKPGVTSAKIPGKVKVYGIEDYMSENSSLVTAEKDITLDYHN